MAASAANLKFQSSKRSEPRKPRRGNSVQAAAYERRGKPNRGCRITNEIGQAMTVKKDTRTPQAKSAELLVAMTGKASPAKAAEGDKPVFAYIESLPEPQKSIAKHVDALAAKALPDLKRAVKWGMAYYGVPDGWCFSSGAFVGHQKLMFIRGNELQPEPPVAPIGMGKATRGVELTAMDELDEDQVLSWMAQAAEKPFVGGKKKK
jgi:hypothetical protein